MKKLIAFLLSCILAVSLCFFNVCAEESESTAFFAKEKGFLFVEPHEYDSMPTSIAMKAENLDYTVNGTCHITEPLIRLNKPDDNGNISYIIQYTIRPFYTIQYLNSNYNPHWDFATWTEELHPFDYYTGLNLFPNDDEMNREVNILYKGENISIKLSRTYTFKWLPYTNENNFTTFHEEGVIDVKIEITAPIEYDGLVLGIQCGEPVSKVQW